LFKVEIFFKVQAIAWSQHWLRNSSISQGNPVQETLFQTLQAADAADQFRTEGQPSLRTPLLDWKKMGHLTCTSSSAVKPHFTCMDLKTG